MINRNSSGKKQYFDDTEFSQELSADPFAEESYGISHIHLDRPCKPGRSKKSQGSEKSKNLQNSEKIKEN